MSITGNDLTTVERSPDIILNLIVRCIFADFGSHLLDPDEDFLVSKPKAVRNVQISTTPIALTHVRDQLSHSEKHRMQGKDQRELNRRVFLCAPRHCPLRGHCGTIRRLNVLGSQCAYE